MASSAQTIASRALPDLEGLLARLRGTAIHPGDAGYDEARTIFNGLIDRRPALIVRPSGVVDVVEVVNYAREQGVLLSVRGGGHNVAGRALNDGGIVLDLSSMRAVSVDPAARTAWVQGGATWGDLDRETQLYGLAAPGGVVSTTGIGGLTLHGGLGHLRREYGLSIDALIGVEIVTADGKVRRASAAEHPDLFWAVRGAGSNFGVITAFEFQLFSVGPEMAIVAAAYRQDAAPAVLRAWRDFVATAPDKVNALAILWNIPEHPAFPPELHGVPIVVLPATYTGPAEEGMEILQPLRDLAEPLVDLSGIDHYTHIQSGFDSFYPVGRAYYWKSAYLDTLSDAAIDTLIECAANRPSPGDALTLWQLGGAIGRIGEADTAFGRRSAPFLLSAEACWDDRATNEANIAWARATLERARPFSGGGTYLNFPGFGEEKEGQLRDAYGANYDRLVAIKTKYDPGNLFRSNLNILPSA